MATPKKIGATASKTKSEKASTAKPKVAKSENANDLSKADSAENKKEVFTSHDDKNISGSGETGKVDQVVTKEVNVEVADSTPGDVLANLKQTHEAPSEESKSDKSEDSGDLNAVQTKVVVVEEDSDPAVKLNYEEVFRKYIQKNGSKKSKATSLTDLWNEVNEGDKRRRSLPVVLAILDDKNYKDFRASDRKALIAGLKKAKSEAELHRFLYSNYAEEQDIRSLNELIKNNG